MWYEAVPSMVAMLASISLLEIGPFACHYISWGCPMMRSSNGQISTQLMRRDQRIAEDQGVRWWAKHQYTYSFGNLDSKTNFDHYKDAEKKIQDNE